MSEARRLLHNIVREVDKADEASRPIPDAGPPVGHRRLCVGMSTYDDFDGVWFTVQTLRMFHPEVLDQVSFLVIDNHPEGSAATSLKAMEKSIPFFRYVPFRAYHSTAVRDLIFREADADIVCCLDSHVLVQPGGLAALIDWFDVHPDSLDLIQGPLWYDDLGSTVSSHFRPTWGAGMYGQWDTDPRVYDAEPFEIEMQGLGLFACRADVWPGINPRFRGFGGEEGYLHEKFRQGGGRVLCHPALKWVHRFGRPSGVPYLLTHEDRIRNYLIGWSEIGWETAPIYAHAREYLGGGPAIDAMLDELSGQANSALGVFDAIFYLGMGEGADASTTALHGDDVEWRVEVFAPSSTHSDTPRSGAQSWAEMIGEATRRGYENFLAIEGRVEINEKTLVGLTHLNSGAWDICVLSSLSQTSFAREDSCVSSRPRAMAVHSRAFAQIVADIQGAGDDCASFLEKWGDFDCYLEQRIADGTLKMALITADGSLCYRTPLDSDDDRPVKASGLEFVELSKGLVVYRDTPEMVCYLNNTASFIFEMCGGLMTAKEIASAMASAFHLDTSPLGEVEVCIARFRRQGIVRQGGSLAVEDSTG